MNRLFVYRSLISLAILFSVYCFLFVNRPEESLSKHYAAKTELYQGTEQEHDRDEHTRVPLPDLSIFEKIIELANRFL